LLEFIHPRENRAPSHHLALEGSVPLVIVVIMEIARQYCVYRSDNIIMELGDKLEKPSQDKVMNG